LRVVVNDVFDDVDGGVVNIEHQIVAHRCTPYCDGVLTNRVACQRAPSS
jgi:hypothetical protein